MIMVFILIFKVSGQTDGNESLYQHSGGFTWLKGFVVPQYEHGLHLTYGRPAGVEFFYSKKTLGKKERERIFGLPQTGYSLTIIDTDMDETGTIFNLAAYQDTYILRTRPLNIFFRLGAGFTYATKIYERENNNLNNILSSRISYHALIRLGMEVNVMPRTYLFPAISWSHTSNGSFSLPNNGINILSVNIGAGYRFGSTQKPAPEDFEPVIVDRKKIGINILLSASGKETEPLGSPKRLYYTIGVSADKTLNKISRVYLGLEAFHNRGLIDVIEAEPDVDNDTDHRRVGLFAGHELMISRVSFLSMFGHYVYRRFYGGEDVDPDFYHRHGFKVYITEHLFTTAFMKVHGAQADVFDFGLGVRL